MIWIQVTSMDGPIHTYVDRYIHQAMVPQVASLLSGLAKYRDVRSPELQGLADVPGNA